MRVGHLLAGAAATAIAVGGGAVACSSSDARSASRSDAGGAPVDASRDVASDASREAAASSRDAAVRDASPNDDDASAPDAAPTLVALDVRATTPGDGSPSFALVPSFAPTVFDYYVRCGAGVNDLTLTMSASPGAESVVVSPDASAVLPTQSVSLGVNEGQAVVVSATRGAATTDYWIRCLPADFPQLLWQPHPEAGAPPPGYYLVGNAQLRDGEQGFAMALNGHGVPVWFRANKGLVNDVDDLVDGSISFYAEPVWQIDVLTPPSVTRLPVYTDDEHELRHLSNGDYLIVYAPLRSGIDLRGYKVPLNDGGFETLESDGTIADCDVVELTPSGTLVWEWVGSDHLDPVKDTAWHVPAHTLADGGVVVDPFHCNSIDVDPKNGDLLVSGRYLDSVVYIDRVTSKILWKMGGKTYTTDDAAYVPVADPFRGQHDARLQPSWTSTCWGGSGQVSVFDDETLTIDPARAVVYDVVVQYGDAGADAACSAPGDAGPSGATVAWQRAGAKPSSGEGSFRISADGSRVIGWGGGASPGDIAFTEVDLAGADLVDFSIDVAVGNTSYRAIKVPLGAYDLEVLRTNTSYTPP